MKRFQIHKGYAARFTPRLTQKSTAQPLAFLLHGHGSGCGGVGGDDGFGGGGGIGAGGGGVLGGGAVLFEQFLKQFYLIGIELLPDFLADGLHDLPGLGGAIGPDAVVLLLAVGDDFLNGDQLGGGQLEGVVELLDELLAEEFGLADLGEVGGGAVGASGA